MMKATRETWETFNIALAVFVFVAFSAAGLYFLLKELMPPEEVVS